MNRIHLSYKIAVFLIAMAVGQVSISRAFADRDIFLADAGGQVAIGSANDTSPHEPDLVTRVFERALVAGFLPFDPTSDYGLDEPGLFALPAGHAEMPPGVSALPSSADVTVNLFPFTVAGESATLFYWDGTGTVGFEPVTASQPDVSLELDPNPIDSTGANGGADIHPTYRLDKSGAGKPADGVYLASPTVSIAGLVPSDRLFLLFLADTLLTNENAAEELLEGLEMGQTMFAGKDFSFFQQASAHVDEHLAVPESSSLALAGLASIIGFVVLRSPESKRSRKR